MGASLHFAAEISFDVLCAPVSEDSSVPLDYILVLIAKNVFVGGDP